MMKKFLLFLMFATIIFLVSCDSDSDNKGTEDLDGVSNSETNSTPDIALNEEIYTQFESEFEEIKTEIALREQIVFDMNIEMDILEDKALIKSSNVKTNFRMNKNPMRIEAAIREGLTTQQYIFEQFGDAVYQYELKENVAIQTFCANADDYENGTENSALGFEFDIETGIAKLEDDYYIFTQKYGDALTDEERSYLKDVYEVLGISLEEVLNSELTTMFKFDDNGFYMSYNILMTVNMQYPDWPGHYEEFVIEALIEYDFLIEEFDMIDLNEFEIACDNMEDIYYYSKLDTDYSYYILNRTYKFKLKKGYYAFETDGLINQIHFLPEFYDENFNLVKIEPIFDGDKNKIFYLNNDGDYYVRIPTDRKFALKEYDISNRKTVDLKLDEEIAFDLNENQCIVMRIDELDSVFFENMGDNDLIFKSSARDGIFTIPAHSKDYVFFGVGPKEVFFENAGSNGSACKIKINKIVSAGVDLSYDELEEITTTPTQGYYISGGYLPSPHVKLIVEESGFYTLKNSCEESPDFSFEMMYYNGGYIQSFGYARYYLAKGEYIIRLSSSYKFSYGNIYYVFEKYEVQTTYEIELETTSKEYYETDYPTIPLWFTIGADSYTYYFTITEDCIVETDNYLYLYDENDEIVTGTSQRIFNLKPGRYYFKYCYRGSEGKEDFKIAIKGTN